MYPCLPRESKKETKKQLKSEKLQFEHRLHQKQEEIKALKENEKKISEDLDTLKAKIDP